MISIACLALPCLLLAADPSLPGPFAVGTSERTVSRADASTFAAALYYPAMEAGVDTAPDSAAAPAPIVTFGHGFLQAVSQYDSTLRHLASHGYVVIASRSASGFFPNHLAFGQDLSFCIDHLLQESADPASAFFGFVSADRIGASGHSMGGGASMLCAQLDARVIAVANLAAAETSTSAIAAAADLNIPLRFIVGDQDSITPTGQHAGPMFDAAPGARQLVTIVGGFHCGFTDASFFGCDSGSITRSEQLAKTRALLLRFFDLHLRGDASVGPQVWGPEAPAVEGTEIEADARIVFTVVPESLEAAAGSDAAFEVTVRNDRPAATDITVRPDDARIGEPVTITALAPGAEESLTLTLSIGSDREPGSTALRLVAEAADHAIIVADIPLEITPPNDLVADLNGDGQVNLEDLLILLSAWGPCAPEDPCPADLDNSGDVTLTDLLILLSAWS